MQKLRSLALIELHIQQYWASKYGKPYPPQKPLSLKDAFLLNYLQRMNLVIEKIEAVMREDDFNSEKLNDLYKTLLDPLADYTTEILDQMQLHRADKVYIEALSTILQDIEGSRKHLEGLNERAPSSHIKYAQSLGGIVIRDFKQDAYPLFGSKINPDTNELADNGGICFGLVHRWANNDATSTKRVLVKQAMSDQSHSRTRGYTGDGSVYAMIMRNDCYKPALTFASLQLRSGKPGASGHIIGIKKCEGTQGEFEVYDPNYGVVRFPNKERAATYLDLLANYYAGMGLVKSYILTYALDKRSLRPEKEKKLFSGEQNVNKTPLADEDIKKMLYSTLAIFDSFPENDYGDSIRIRKMLDHLDTTNNILMQHFDKIKIIQEQRQTSELYHYLHALVSNYENLSTLAPLLNLDPKAKNFPEAFKSAIVEIIKNKYGETAAQTDELYTWLLNPTEQKTEDPLDAKTVTKLIDNLKYYTGILDHLPELNHDAEVIKYLSNTQNPEIMASLIERYKNEADLTDQQFLTQLHNLAEAIENGLLNEGDVLNNPNNYDAEFVKILNEKVAKYNDKDREDALRIAVDEAKNMRNLTQAINDCRQHWNIYDPMAAKASADIFTQNPELNSLDTDYKNLVMTNHKLLSGITAENYTPVPISSSDDTKMLTTRASFIKMIALSELNNKEDIVKAEINALVSEPYSDNKCKVLLGLMHDKNTGALFAKHVNSELHKTVNKDNYTFLLPIVLDKNYLDNISAMDFYELLETIASIGYEQASKNEIPVGIELINDVIFQMDFLKQLSEQKANSFLHFITTNNDKLSSLSERPKENFERIKVERSGRTVIKKSTADSGRLNQVIRFAQTNRYYATPDPKDDSIKNLNIKLEQRNEEASSSRPRASS